MTTKTADETGNAVIYHLTGKGHEINVASDVWPVGEVLEIYHRIKAAPSSSFSNNNYSPYFSLKYISTTVLQATPSLRLCDF